MNYYEARQVDPTSARSDAGKWRYTCMNDGRVWPVGLCADGCTGHETAEEANEHYHRGLLSDLTEFAIRDQALRCEAHDSETGDRCAALTSNGLQTGPGNMLSWMLCDRHRNDFYVNQLWPDVGTMMGSY